MKAVVSLSLVLLAVALAEANNCLMEVTDDPDADYARYQKCADPNYKSDDKHQERLKHFRKCHKSARNHDSTKSGHQVGITKFWTWTEEEFNNSLNHELANAASRASGPWAPTFYSQDSDTGNWSWVDKGAVTPVKNQGQCGCCYAFAAAAALEGAQSIKYQQLYNLSTQEITSCTKGYGIRYNGNTPVADPYGGVNNGCNGGDYTVVYVYLQQVNPAVTWECYPYTSGTTNQAGTCKIPSCPNKVKAGPYVVLPSNNETALKHAIKNIGPVACAVDANPLKNYKGGIISSPAGNVNHAVTVVGFGKSPSGEQFWIVKNSWGTDWGVKGYFYVKYGVNALKIATYCAYPNAAAAAAL